METPTRVQPFSNDFSVFSMKSFFGSQEVDWNSVNHLVEQLRNNVLTTVGWNRTLYDPRDIQKVETNDWYVKRFLLDKKGNVQEAKKALIECLLYRKKLAINDLKGHQFPKELFRLGFIERGEDTEGNLVVYFRWKRFAKIEGASELFKRAFEYVINMVDEEANERQYGVVHDLTNTGVNQFDHNLFSHCIGVSFKCFVLGTKFVWMFDPPWLLRPILPLILRAFPQKYNSVLKVVERQNVHQMAEKCNLPTFMGGTLVLRSPFSHDAPLLEEVAHVWGLSDETVARFEDHFVSVIN